MKAVNPLEEMEKKIDYLNIQVRGLAKFNRELLNLTDYLCSNTLEEKDVDKYEKRRNAFIPKIRTDEYSLDEYKDVHDLKGE